MNTFLRGRNQRFFPLQPFDLPRTQSKENYQRDK